MSAVPVSTEQAAGLVDVSDLSGHLELIESVGDKIKELAAFKKDLEDIVRTRLGDAQEGKVPGWTVTYRQYDETRIVADLVRRLYPDIVQQVSKTTPKRTLLISRIGDWCQRPR